MKIDGRRETKPEHPTINRKQFLTQWKKLNMFDKFWLTQLNMSFGMVSVLEIDKINKLEL
jgi:hypothetical protein